jgi:hypothetical protein
MGQHVTARHVVGADIRVDVGDQRVFAQILVDDSRYIGIDGFVIGDSCAGRVSDGHVPGPPHSHQTGNSQHRVRPEHLGIEKEIVDPSVDDVHSHPSADSAHVQAVIGIDHQVMALDQVGAHLLGQICMLEVGRVEYPRSQDHHRGRLPAAR